MAKNTTNSVKGNKGTQAKEPTIDTTKVIKTPEEREAEFLAERDAEICKKYKNVTPGSIRRETEGHHAGKLTVEITCNRKRRREDGTEYVCGNKRRVATSDLFQVKFCEECIAELRLAKRRKKAKLGRMAKKEAAEASGTAKPAKPAKKALKAPKKKMRNVEEVAAEAATKKSGEQVGVPSEGEIQAQVGEAVGSAS